jgi:hypothetical protein
MASVLETVDSFPGGADVFERAESAVEVAPVHAEGAVAFRLGPRGRTVPASPFAVGRDLEGDAGSAERCAMPGAADATGWVEEVEGGRARLLRGLERSDAGELHGASVTGWGRPNNPARAGSHRVHSRA